MYQPSDPPGIHGMALALQVHRHARSAEEGCAQILLVEQPHQVQILGGFAGRCTMEPRTTQP